MTKFREKKSGERKRSQLNQQGNETSRNGRQESKYVKLISGYYEMKNADKTEKKNVIAVFVLIIIIIIIKKGKTKKR
jgi:hypothetical protein